MDSSPNLTLPYIIAAQAQKHVTHNEAIRGLDAIVQLMVLDKDLASPPGSLSDGNRYIVAGSPTGAWAGQTAKVAAWQDGVWTFYAPHAGWLAWVADEAKIYVHNGSAWGEITVAVGSGAALWGINATADTTNRLALKSAASLFDNVGNGHQHKINKAAAGDTASLLFQTAYSGRAEFGTTGDDDFHVKVSPDGSAWNDGMIVDKATGAARFPSTTYLDLPAASAPATPASGKVRIYAKTDKLFYQKDDAGTETGLAGGGTTYLPSGLVINGKIAESHASNAATFAVKTLAGADPSAGDPVTILFPDGTTRTVTAALSLVVSSGSTLGVSNAVINPRPFRLWFALIDDAGTIRLGVRNCSDAAGIYGFPGHGLLSSTAEGGAGSADSAGVTYTGTAVSAKQFVMAAFADYDSGLTTVGTWTASPTRIQMFGPGMRKPGDVVQAIQASSSSATDTTSSSFQTTGLSVVLTPTSKCNGVKVSYQAQARANDNTAAPIIGLHRDSTQVGPLGCFFVNSAVNHAGPASGVSIDYPGSVSAITYMPKIRASVGSAGTVTFNYQVIGAPLATMLCEEIMG